MGLIEALAELVCPTRCAGCDAPGALVCESCAEALPLIDEDCACPRCGAPWGRLQCTECVGRVWSFSAVLSLGEFESVLARAVVLHKDAGERRLADVFAELLATRVVEAWPGWPDAVAFVPATRAALLRRGFDHGRSIAENLAGVLGLPLDEALRRASARDQRVLGREARSANVAGSFSAVGRVGGRVLLVDDVFTTGATLDEAAAVLLEAGADEVRCATVARAW